MHLVSGFSLYNDSQAYTIRRFRCRLSKNGFAEPTGFLGSEETGPCSKISEINSKHNPDHKLKKVKSPHVDS